MSHPSPPPTTQNKFLLWGSRGWIATHLHTLLQHQRKDVHTTTTRMEDQSAVHYILDGIKPTHVIVCAGVTGRPNVDWCEDHKIETVESNVTGVLVVVKACRERGVHVTVLGTGCIYTSTYDFTNPLAPTLTSKPFNENAPANFQGSFYSYTKSRVEDILRHYPQTLILRLRMPVSDDLHPRSFVTKITNYDRVVNIPNSHSILHDLLPLVIALAEHGEEGVYNFTNPGAISHNEVLGMYKEIVDPGFEWKNFSVEEQAGVIKAERSNCELDCGKLLGKVREYCEEGAELEVPEIGEAYRRCFGRMKEGMQMQQRPGASQRTSSV